MKETKEIHGIKKKLNKCLDRLREKESIDDIDWNPFPWIPDGRCRFLTSKEIEELDKLRLECQKPLN